jgi:hypothetical protein
VLVHQCPDSVWRIDWQVPAGFDLAGERASGALDTRVRAIVGDTAYEVVWATVYRFHERCAETFGIGRVLLAGDAAHLYAPFGARGLNSGIQDADNLAWKIAFVRHGWGGPALPGSYDHERRAAALENLRVTGATMRFLVPRDAGQRARRISVLERAVTDPAARPLVDSGKLAEPYWYLDSPLTTPAGPVEDFPVAPGAPRPPVPGVLCPDGACVAGGTRTRLRRLFGAGLVVLASGRETAAVAARAAEAAVSAPVTTYALDDLDDLGPAAALREALRARPGDHLVVRPDGHLAAVLAGPDPADVAHPAAVAADPATGPATGPASGSTADLTAGLTAALRRVVGN